MIWTETIRLRDGRECVLRSGGEADGRQALDCFIRTHAQTDWLLTYPEEILLSPEQEGEYLEKRTASPREVEILAVVDGQIVGLAGVDALSAREKVRHRASFGISIDREYWGLGIGRAMLRACIACAKKAGYAQLELDVVSDNDRALALYESEGFAECGRNPRGCRSRTSGWQELVSMRLELDEQGSGVID